MVEDPSRKQHASKTLLENPDDEKCHLSIVNIEKPPLLISKRFLIIMLIFVSNVNMILIRCNMNIAIIEMTSSKQVFIGNHNITQPPEFSWDSKTIGIVLSIFSYGKSLSFLSGPLISRLGGSVSWSLSLLACAIVTLVQPICLRYNLYSFFFCRFLTGVFDSFYNASIIATYSRWIPKSERGTLISICFNGINIGIAVVYPISGYVVSEWGWPMIFYVTGVICLTLSLICLLVARNNPSEDKWISKKELSFILRETDTICVKKVMSNPYKHILKSPPVWALCMGYFVTSWIITTLLNLPLFIKDLTKKDTKEVAFISSIPNIAGIFSSFIAGTLTDYWKNKTNIKLTRMHKLLMTTAFVSQAVLFIILTYVSEFIITSMVIFVVIRILFPFAFLVQQLISVSIAPNHTGAVAGLTTSWFSISMIMGQMVTGFMTVNHTSDEWNHCFLLTAGILALGAIIFLLYGSSEAQPWSISPNLEDPSKRFHSPDKSESQLLEK